MVTIPDKIKHYLDDEKNVPLIGKQNSLWYYISLEEKELLAEFVAEIDRIPESVWRQYPEDVILEYSHKGNLAARIVHNCIIKNKEDDARC